MVAVVSRATREVEVRWRKLQRCHAATFPAPFLSPICRWRARTSFPFRQQSLTTAI